MSGDPTRPEIPSPPEGGTRPRRRDPRTDESLLIGGLSGVALVTAATLALLLAGALIAAVVALFYG